MEKRAWGALVQDKTILMVQQPGTIAGWEWILPGRVLNRGESFEACSCRAILETSGIVVQPRRLLYEDLDQPNGDVDKCGLMEMNPRKQPVVLNVPVGTTANTAHPPGPRKVAWIPLAEVAGHTQVSRVIRVIPCTVERFPGRIPFNWAEIPDKGRELTHRIRRIERYFVAALSGGKQDEWWYQSLFRVADHIPELPLQVWAFTAKWGCHDDREIRIAVAVCVLEHLLELHFDRCLPLVADLALTNSHFADTFLGCSQFGQAELPHNQTKWDNLSRELREKWLPGRMKSDDDNC